MQFKIFKGKRCLILSDITIWNWQSKYGFQFVSAMMIHMAGIFMADVMCKAEAELRGII